MWLKYLLPLTGFLFSGYTWAQDKHTTTKDSVEHSIMLIPYDPRFYLSDADKDIAEATKKTPQTIRTYFHNRAEWFTWRELKRIYPTVSLLQNDTLQDYIAAAGSLFSVTAFEYATPSMKIPEQIVADMPSASKNASDSRIATNYLNNDNHNRYMKADIKNKSILTQLGNQYGTDIFVFLTQFEIKTNYKNCLDIANKIYEREIRLHFTIYDKNGKLIGGNYAVATIPSDVNHMDEIVLKCFPLLSKGIAAAL
jgi:hypothetical protein